MAFPQTRMRRLRRNAGLRGLVRETDLSPSQLILPLFVSEAEPSGAEREPIEAMPGVQRLSLAAAVQEAQSAAALGIAGVMLFGVPADKDEEGSSAWDEEGIVQLAVRAIKEGAEQFLTKPVQMQALLVIIERLLDNQRVRQRDVARTTQQERTGAVDPFIGVSPAIASLKEQVDRVATTDRPILILGETGTLEAGKRCDLAIWDIDRPAELVYRMGFNPLQSRVWMGR